MAAAHIGAVARGIFLVHLHIGQQAGARVAAFHQVVAENAVVRESVP